MKRLQYRLLALIMKAHNDDKQAREQLIIENSGLIWSIIQRFKGRGVETEDPLAAYDTAHSGAY